MKKAEKVNDSFNYRNQSACEMISDDESENEEPATASAKPAVSKIGRYPMSYTLYSIHIDRFLISYKKLTKSWTVEKDMKR